MFKRSAWKACEEKNVKSFLGIFCKKYTDLFMHHKNDAYFFKGQIDIFQDCILPILEKHKSIISHNIVSKYNNMCNDNGLIIEFTLI